MSCKRPLSAQQRRRQSIRCATPTDTKANSIKAGQQAAMALLLTANAAALAAILAGPAHAKGYEWRPRRHTRRMFERHREPDLGPYSRVLVHLTILVA